MDDEESEDENEDDSTLEEPMDRIVREQENDVEIELADNVTNDKIKDNNNLPNNSNVWFDKLLPFIKHFRYVSMSLIFTLGTYLEIDEMMVRFTVRSSQTHRMKTNQ